LAQKALNAAFDRSTVAEVARTSIPMRNLNYAHLIEVHAVKVFSIIT
jgi:hypothetical protein